MTTPEQNPTPYPGEAHATSASGAPDQASTPGPVSAPGRGGVADSSTKWRRLHPLSPLLRGGIVMLVIFGVIIANFRDRFVELLFSLPGNGPTFSDDGAGERERDSDALDSAANGDMLALLAYLGDHGMLLYLVGGILLVVLMIVGISWLSWRFHSYRITADAVEERSGVVARKHRRAPLERIQSVNLQRRLLARILGLTKIEIVTAGQGGKVDLSYLSHANAKVVREQILRSAALKRAAREGNPVTDPTQDGEVTAAPPVGLDGYVYAAPADPLSSRVYDFADIDVDPEAIAENTLVAVPSGRLIASILLGWEAVTLLVMVAVVIVSGATVERAILLVLVPLILVTASLMITQFNRGFRFTLSRARDAVRTGSGLTSTQTETVPFGRIHAVEARQPLLWRPFGWWKVRVTTAGRSVAQGGQNQVQNVVLPVGREEDVLRVLATVLPGVGADEPSLAALHNGLSGTGAGYVRAPRRAAPLLWFGTARAGIDVVSGVDGSATLRIRRGFLTRSFGVMPVPRGQSVLFHRSAPHAALGLAIVQAHTVLGPVVMRMRGLRQGDAQQVFDRIAAAAIREEQ